MNPRTLLMHQIMLSDRTRLAAYDRALAAAVRAGDVVADVGAGTLVLGLMALRHGAGHVYAIEGDPATAELAARIARDNGVAEHVTVIQGDARAAKLERKADVVVAELMGNLGPEEEMAEILAAFARRNLADHGRIVPGRLQTVLTPVEFDGEGWGIWSEELHGLRFGAVLDHVAPAAQLHFFQRPPRVLGGPVVAADARLGERARPIGGERHIVRIDTPGTLHAIVGSFRAVFASGVELANFPGYPGCNWACWVWPVRHSRVAAGDTLKVALERPRDTARLAETWTMDVGLARGSVWS
ncbi:methyltransferase domain-containing protein [Amycolatopsis rhizosphaerae]|uniref:Methyltransferase domain-containing protein n=1 Tax=Amycolatopsis rhizosphaerae TaxID=2053003 RepID=A0A558BKP5_9PSEU|nr:50S ribosomal protein L11 methyltransferase [Amycolatopsis rhizosphaerae]TVT37088.1 methyltransferase domain-containing protein [Amycolatopsis rhizosphaerae]